MAHLTAVRETSDYGLQKAELGEVTALRHPAAVYLDQLSPHSRASNRSRLDIMAGIIRPGTDATTFPWSSLTINDTTALRATLAERYNWTTVNAYLSSLRGVLRAAWLTGQMSTDAYQRTISVPKLRGKVIPSGRHVGADEFHALFSRLAADPSNKARRDLAVFALARSTGARREELANLDLDDIDLDDLVVRIVNGKGNRSRLIGMAGWCRPVLLAWLQARGTTEGALFTPVRQGGSLPKDLRHLTVAGMDDVLKRRLREYGLPHFTWHDFRRTLAGDLLDQNADIEAIQRQLGHATVAQTVAYSRRPLRQLRKVAQQVPSPFGSDDK